MGETIENNSEIFVEVVENPELVVTEVDVVVSGPDPNKFDVNLAEFLDEDTLNRIGAERVDVYRALAEARREHDDFLVRHIRLLGIGPRIADTPIEGGCTALHPLLMESAVKFQARAIQELWPARGPVRTEVLGHINEERLAQAARVRAHMNYQLTREVAGAYSDRERGLFRLAILGTNIMKAGWSEARRTLDPVIVPMEKFYVDPAVTHLKYADEYIEVSDFTGFRMRELVAKGFFRDIQAAEESIQITEIERAINEAQGIQFDGIRSGYSVGESHCYLDLHGLDPLVPAGEVAPYIVHFNVNTGAIYAIRRNWRPGDPQRNRRMWYVAETFIPGFGFFGYGYIHLIGDLAQGATTLLRALADSAMYANFQGGFKTKVAKLAQPDEPIRFGEWRDVEATPEDLQRSFFPLPFKEPSPVLLNLLQYIVGAGQRFADVTDQVVGEAANYGPVATTLAILEASQRFQTSIHKRLHKTQEEFFTLLAELNYEYLPEVVRFVVGTTSGYVRRIDYDPAVVAVLPASDPDALTETQRVAKAQIILETASRYPQHVDIRKALRDFYAAMGVDDLDILMPDPETTGISADPLTEIQVAMRGRPIVAKLGQDHEAHIAVKTLFLQQPQMQGTNDPTVVAGITILKNNIAEHKTLLFIAQIMQQAVAAGLPPDDPQVQAKIALAMLQQSAEQGAALSGGQVDPELVMLQLQAKELEIADKRVEAQTARENAKLALKAREQALKEQILLKDMQLKNMQAERDAAKKILDTYAKMADVETKRLNALTKAHQSS